MTARIHSEFYLFFICYKDSYEKTLLKLTALAAGMFSLTACDKSPETTVTAKSKTVFVAGATGVIGEPLTKALVEKGYIVYGTTRSADKAKTWKPMV